MVVNPYLTLSKVDSIICGRALSSAFRGAGDAKTCLKTLHGDGSPAVGEPIELSDAHVRPILDPEFRSDEPSPCFLSCRLRQ
jgi:hypothetical protein